MQNKPNFRKAKMNVGSIITMIYKIFIPLAGYKNKPNSNPIKANFKKAKMNVNLTLTKDYRKNDDFLVRKNKPNSNPISKRPKMNTNAFSQEDYENETAFRPQKNKPKTNPISNALKIFLNLPEILNQIDRVASQLTEPTAFYLGKLQDGLALDALTGYSRIMIPFFARQKQARLTLLTKSANVENLLDLDHHQHTILSWSLNPPEVSSAFERNVPSPDERITAMQKCADAGYPLRAVIMPIIPVEGWQKIYANFIENLLMSVPLERVTLGHICSYSAALKLTERKLGRNNPISSHLEKTKSNDGRTLPFQTAS